MSLNDFSEFLITTSKIIAQFWGIILTISAPLFFIFDIFSIRTELKKWKKERKDFKDAISQLKVNDYFIVHVIQVGGISSKIYSMQAYSDIEGGVYLNPTEKFVSIGSNRGGDLIVLCPTEITRKMGFVIDSIGTTALKFEKGRYPDLAHLPVPNIKNEYFVKLVKKG